MIQIHRVYQVRTKKSKTGWMVLVDTDLRYLRIDPCRNEKVVIMNFDVNAANAYLRLVDGHIRIPVVLVVKILECTDNNDI